MWLPPTQLNGNVFYIYTIITAVTNSLVTNRVTVSTQVTVTGLNAFTNYTCTVTAATFAGSSDAITDTFMTLQGSKFIILNRLIFIYPVIDYNMLLGHSNTGYANIFTVDCYISIFSIFFKNN